MHEAQLHKENSFLTLTLNEKTLAEREGWEPAVPSPLPQNRKRHTDTLDGTHARNAHAQTSSLYKRDVQLFIKRLRKDQETRGLPKVKFYACGEYGDMNGRPHYHIALFGEDFAADRREWRKSDAGNQLYRSSRLEALWPHGGAEIGELTFASAAYIARYIMKKITGGLADTHYQRVKQNGEIIWITPEFSLMSRGGRKGKGLGHGWFEKFGSDVYPHDYVVMNGKQLKPPRYYDEQYKLNDEVGAMLLKLEREFQAKAKEADNTPQRLATKEKVAQANMNQGKRSL